MADDQGIMVNVGQPDLIGDAHFRGIQPDGTIPFMYGDPRFSTLPSGEGSFGARNNQGVMPSFALPGSRLATQQATAGGNPNQGFPPRPGTQPFLEQQYRRLLGQNPGGLGNIDPKSLLDLL